MKKRPEEWEERKTALALMGQCLLCVQQAEQALSLVVETVLSNSELDFMEQTDSERRKTLGDVIRQAKVRAKLDPHIKDKLYRFLNMRNKFVHDVKEVPGWDLKTKDGRQAARMFIAELCFTAIAISALCGALLRIFEREELGTDVLNDEKEETKEFAALVETKFGPMARKILQSRNRRPILAPVAPKR